MFQENPTRFGSRAHVIDDRDMMLRLFRRGTRQLGERCRLTIALNGEEQLKLEEDAGDRAPRELVVDIRTRVSEADTLIQALRTRPWSGPDGPVIMFSSEGAGASGHEKIGYLIRTAEIVEILEAIREALDIRIRETDLAAGMLMPVTRLDAAAARG